MDESDFEGTLVLEKLAEIGKVDAFFAAIDSYNFGKAQALMKKANIDAETIIKPGYFNSWQGNFSEFCFL